MVTTEVGLFLHSDIIELTFEGFFDSDFFSSLSIELHTLGRPKKGILLSLVIRVLGKLRSR